MRKNAETVKKGKPALLVGLVVLCILAVILLLGKNTSQPKTDEQDLPPWEMGGKVPIEYTWEEFEALEGVHKDLFFESFGSVEAFDVWMIQAGGPVQQEAQEMERPWETGGNAPAEYTWEEYQALSPELQDAFFESFDSAESFDAWKNAAEGPAEQTVSVPEYPWEQGGKTPEEYAWEEFLGLPEEQKDAFVESFGSMDAFEAWQSRVNPEPAVEATTEATTEPASWEGTGKQPEEYTWEEFLALSPEDQEAFFLSFATPEDFEAWMNRVNPQ